MKYVVIADSVQSNLIYCDHPNGAMAHLLIDQTQSMLETNLGATVSHWRAGAQLFVLGRFANVAMMVVSDAGESVRVLQNQLRLLYDLLLLSFGYALLHERRSVNFAKFTALIRSLVDTASLLAERHAAVLVQATEQVEVTDDIRLRFAAMLRAACAPVAPIAGAFVFVGTKLLTSYARPKAAGVHPIDVLLLSIFLTSQFDPPLRHATRTAPLNVPVADYSNLDTAPVRYAAPPAADTAASTPAAAAPAVGDAEDDGRSSAGGSVLSNLVLPTELLSSAIKNAMGGAADAEANDGAASAASAAPPSDADVASASALPAAGDSAPSAPAGDVGPLFKVLYLRPAERPSSSSRDVTARRVYLARLMDSITFVAVLRDDANASEQRAALDAVRDELSRKLLKDYAEYLLMRATTHFSMLNYVYDLPGLVHFIFVDRTAHRVLVPTITPLHGQACTSHTPATSARMVQILQSELWNMVSFAQSALVRGSISTLVRRGAFLYSSRLWIEDGDGFELIIEQPLFSDAALVRDAGGAGSGGSRHNHHNAFDTDDGLGDEDRWAGGGSGSGSGGGGGQGGLSANDWASTNSNTWGPEFYPALVQRLYPTQRYVRIYELYSLYIGIITANHVAVCDRKLLSSLQIT